MSLIAQHAPRAPRTARRRRVGHLLAGAAMIEDAPEEYRAMAETARARMAGYAGHEVVAEALREALSRLPDVPTGRFAWAS